MIFSLSLFLSLSLVSLSLSHPDHTHGFSDIETFFVSHGQIIEINFFRGSHCGNVLPSCFSLSLSLSRPCRDAISLCLSLLSLSLLESHRQWYLGIKKQ